MSFDRPRSPGDKNPDPPDSQRPSERHAGQQQPEASHAHPLRETRSRAEYAREVMSRPPIQPDRPVRTSSADASLPTEEALRKRVAELEAENAKLGKGMKELSADNSVRAKTIKELRSAKAEQEHKNAEQDKQIADLKTENASLNRELGALKAENAERDRKDAARDAKVADLEARFSELRKERGDIIGEQPKNATIDERTTGGATRESKAEKHQQRWHLPSDVTNSLVASALGVVVAADHVPHNAADYGGIGVTVVAFGAAGVAWVREHMKNGKAKNDAGDRPQG